MFTILLINISNNENYRQLVVQSIVLFDTLKD